MTSSCLIPGGTGGYRCGERRIYIKVLGQVGKMNDNSCQKQHDIRFPSEPNDIRFPSEPILPSSYHA